MLVPDGTNAGAAGLTTGGQPEWNSQKIHGYPAARGRDEVAAGATADTTHEPALTPLVIEVDAPDADRFAWPPCC